MYLVALMGFGSTQLPPREDTSVDPEVQPYYYSFVSLLTGSPPKLLDRRWFLDHSTIPSDIDWTRSHITIMSLQQYNINSSTSSPINVELQVNTNNYLIPVAITIDEQTIPLISNPYAYMSFPSALQDRKWLLPLSIPSTLHVTGTMMSYPPGRPIPHSAIIYRKEPCVFYQGLQ
jgi:hypothetical protein